MAIIHCTQKLLTEMTIQPADLVAIEPDCSQTVLEEWYANLAVIKRQKIVVFINPSTLFVTLAFGVRRSDLRNLQGVFLESIMFTLQSEGVESAVVQKLVAHFETTQIAKTSDRRTLGYLNDVIHQLTWRVEHDPISSQEAIASITRQLNRIPWVKTQFIYAVNAMEPVLKNTFGWGGQFDRR
jgi:hypothetical protein